MRSVICLIFLVLLPLYASSSWGMIVASQRDSYLYDGNPESGKGRKRGTSEFDHHGLS